MDVFVAPSLLAADMGQLRREIKAVTDAGADWLHLDIMDGHFVPRISFGPDIVKLARDTTDIPLDVHLMISQPERQIESFAEAGADRITFHIEASAQPGDVIRLIKQRNLKVGVAIKPNTSLADVESVAPELDLLLVMTVEPGWGGQEFIPDSPARIRSARELLRQSNSSARLEVDGGIDRTTAPLALAAGADVLVAGTSIFKADDYRRAISALRPAPRHES